MNIKLITLALLGTIGLSACSSMGKPGEVKKPNFPSMTVKTVKVKKGFSVDGNFKPLVGTVKGDVWDMGKSTIELTGGRCDNTESGERVVVRRDNLTIKNGAFTHWEDGISIDARNVTFENVVFENCEDAANTLQHSESFTFKNCYFAPHPNKSSTEHYKGDKGIQGNFNAGNNTIEGCTFWNFINPIRHGLKKYDKPQYVGKTTIKNNKFIFVGTAIQRTTGKLEIGKNKYEAVAQEYKESE